MTFIRDEALGSPIQQQMPDDAVVEVLIRPRDMHTWMQGDCDDYVTYGAALLIALGVPVSFCTVAADARVPEQYTHVYLVAYPAGVRTPLDLSHGQHIGWEVPNAYRKQEWPVTGAAGFGSGLLEVAGMALGIWLAARKGAR
jgi:hypothetical protein